MKLSTHLIVQALLMIVQIGNMLTATLSPNGQKWTALVVGVAQAGLAWYNHNYNPDGTPATVAYIPSQK